MTPTTAQKRARFAERDAAVPDHPRLDKLSKWLQSVCILTEVPKISQRP